MPQHLSPAQQTHVERLYRYLQVEHAAPEAILQWFRRIPRHHFVDTLYLYDPVTQRLDEDPLLIHPATSEPSILARIYVDTALPIQVQEGVCTSSTSQPSLMAQMMVDAGLQPGTRVLEIGTATGWNAALMAAVVAPGGEVVSIECDPDLAERARRHLGREGFGERVIVQCGDGVAGCSERGPFDAIVVTVSCPDVPRSWRQQLAPGGRLVMPLLLPDGAAPMLVLERQGERFLGRFLRWSWFVHLRGGALASWPAPVDPDFDAALASLLALPATGSPLPWSLAGDERHTASGFAYDLEASARDHLICVRDPDGPPRTTARYALCDGDASLALLHPNEIVGHGSPAMTDRLLDHAAAWLGLGAPNISDYSVEVREPGIETPPLAFLRPQTALNLSADPPRREGFQPRR